jgi:transcriptional regulator with PAS, ATPase and Fis domain
LIESYGDFREYGHALRIKGAALAMVARPDEARPILQLAIKVLRARNDQRELAISLMTLAELDDQDPSISSSLSTEAAAILKRLQLPRLLVDAQHIADVSRLRHQSSERSLQQLRSRDGAGRFVAEAESMRLLLADCRLVAQSHAAVVISGETGVGKEVVARFIHESSLRSRGPFFAINCAATPEALFEREFFGHAKGAFTGADRTSKGFVDAANGGTLFLDEIGELPLPMQAKLLRLLQEHTYRRVGDVTELRADIRIIAATNRNLKEQVEEKTFREDLWYRLKAFEVRIPPLRERIEDIPALTDLFLERESERAGIEFWMDREVRQLFERYPWPGNVRELEAAVAAGTARAIEDGCIRVEHLPYELRGSRGTRPTAILSLTKHLEIEERRLILHALRHCNNSRAEAARYLGIGRNTLYEKMQRLGIALGKEARG